MSFIPRLHIPFLCLFLAAQLGVTNGECSKNNCLRGLMRLENPLALQFCNSAANGTLYSGTAKLNQNCDGQVSRAQSACSCLSVTPSTTSSASSTSMTLVTTTSSASDPVDTSSVPPDLYLKENCDQTFKLNGVSESAFNPAMQPFSLSIPCGELDPANYTVLSNWVLVEGTSATSTSIQIPGLPSGYSLLTIATYDKWGDSLFQSFGLLFGSATLTVTVLDSSGNPAAGVSVEANATTQVGISFKDTTNDAGVVVFHNVPVTTIGLLAKTTNNQVGISGIAGGVVTSVTLKLLPLSEPLPGAPGWDVANGTSGWTGGSVQDVDPNLKKRDNNLLKRDTSLVVSTIGKPDLQLASRSFALDSGKSSVYIRYKFQTDEVPGGYFGTQYNDYYSVMIRSNTGNIGFTSHSMNELGLGAFNAGGATQWFTLNMDLTKGSTSVTFNVGVSNVADSALQSKVIVGNVGECNACDSCDLCPNNPQCQDICKSPPLNSCSFYQTCLESSVICGPSGYPLGSGLKTCNRFQNAVDKFSAAGKAWYPKAEQCLQQALVPYESCSATCDMISSAAFSNLPYCYLTSGAGICALDGMDYVYILGNLDSSAYRKALREAIATGQCAKTIADKISATTAEKLHAAAQNQDVKQNVADAKALTVAYKFYSEGLTDGPLADVAAAVKYMQRVYDTAAAYKKEAGFFGGLTVPSVNQLATMWLRHLKYNSNTWFLLLETGISDAWLDFARDTGLRMFDSYPDPSGGAVGFDHLAATLEGVLLFGTGSQADIAGWAGDLFQLYHDWQASKQTATAFVTEYFGKAGKDTGFPLEDLRQDADGFNIGMKLRSSGSSTIADSFAAVVQGGGYAHRFKDFFQGRFGGSSATASAVCMNYMTTGITSPIIYAARGSITQWKSTWGGAVTDPTALPQSSLQGFCNVWASKLATFAASG